MTIRYRSEQVFQTDRVRLRALFDDTGTPQNLDSFPQISIVQPNGNVALSPTSAGMTRIGIGHYEFEFGVGINDQVGVWTDYWTGTLNGQIIRKTFNFVVTNTNLPSVNSDGYLALGDKPGFNFSQEAIANINQCLELLRARLNSSGWKTTKDVNGNKIYVSCDIFSTETLVTMLISGLSIFNSVPTFTNFKFHDTEFFEIFIEPVVEGAVIIALASKALIEKGREFSITDNGLSFNPATVADVLQSQYSTELTAHRELIKQIKLSMRPAPLGLGVMNPYTGGRNTWASRLRHLNRGRAIY